MTIYEEIAIGNLEGVQKKIENGVNVNTTSVFGYTLLDYATKFKQLNVIRYLLIEGADPNKIDDFGYTPLIYAAANNHLEMVQCLLINGANSNYFIDSFIFLRSVRVIGSIPANKPYPDHRITSSLVVTSINIFNCLYAMRANNSEKTSVGITAFKIAQVKRHNEIVTCLRPDKNGLPAYLITSLRNTSKALGEGAQAIIGANLPPDIKNVIMEFTIFKLSKTMRKSLVQQHEPDEDEKASSTHYSFEKPNS